VVLLNNADFLLPASAIMDQTLRQTLLKDASRQIDFYGESLDLLRFPHQIEPEMVALLRKKYEGTHVDLVLARAPGGLEFAARHRDELWPGVPIVLYNDLAETFRGRDLPTNSTALLIDLDPAGTIEMVRQLHPDARHLYVVGGAAEYDQGWKRRIEAILVGHPDSMPVTWLDDLPLPRILEELSHLPRDSVVLYTSMVRDVTGRPQDSPQVAGLVSTAANVPVYGFLDTYIGHGIVGGAITDFAGQGRAAAQLALRILNGEPASSIPIQPSPPARCVVDARALERWSIDERRLPAGCEVRFRSPSLWRDYRWYVFGALLALALQSALMAALIIQRRRRRMAEQAVQMHRSEVAHASRLAVAGELTASIAHEINQPLGAILSNIDTAELLVQSGDDRSDLLQTILADIRRDDLRASEVIRRLRALLAKHEVEQKPFDLNAAVTEVAALLQVEAERRGVTIEIRLASVADMVGDRIQIQQVLINLLLNAMDAVREVAEGRRTIIATVNCTDSNVNITVRDQGHGIAVEDLPRLFDSFYSTKREGMGLGLSISRTIVEAHGGRIWAESGQDDGAVFHVEFPAIERSAER
jgi:signal transduction histidine kinase